MLMSDKTLEQGNYGIIIEGKNKGKAFIKTMEYIKYIDFNSLPFEIKQIYKKIKT